MLCFRFVSYKDVISDGGRCFKGVHLSQVHQQSKSYFNIARLVHLRQVHPLKLLHDLLATNHVDALAELRCVGAEVASVDAVDAVISGFVGYGDAVDAVNNLLEGIVENIVVVATANVERDRTLRALDVGDGDAEIVSSLCSS